MIYIYDILLNFNKELFEYYEWTKEDNITHIKRIKLFKITSEQIDDLFKYNIKLDKEILNLIYNKTELYRKPSIEYSALFTDGYRTIAIIFNKDGKSIEKSRLVLEEEEEILDISRKIDVFNINYKKNQKIKIEFLTRKETILKQNLINYFNKLYKNKNKATLEYIYLDYFEEVEKDIDKIYKRLIKSLNNITDKHKKIVNIIELSNKNKSTT